jgi:hypothetical protein
LRHSILRPAALAIAGAALVLSAVPALAADEPVLTGTILDASGQPFEIVDADMTMTAPDGGGVHAAPMVIAADGSFEVGLMPWGTADNPAVVEIVATGVQIEAPGTEEGCLDQVVPTVDVALEVALESGGEPVPVELVAENEVVSTVCGATGTSAPTLPPSNVDPTAAPVVTSPPAAPAAPLAAESEEIPMAALGLLALAVIVVAGALVFGMRSRSRA